MSSRSSAEHPDGRLARRELNRRAVLDAVVEMFERGGPEPSIDDIAVLSGVSTRSIYRYFRTRDELIHGAMWHVMERLGPAMTLSDVGVGDLAQRIERFASHRIAMYLKLAPLTRAAKRLAASEPHVRQEVDAGRLILRQQFLDHFALEFDQLHGKDRLRAVVAAELPFQFEGFEYLYRACGHDADEMKVLLIRQLSVQFAHEFRSS